MRYLQKQRNLLISYHENKASKIKGKNESRSVTPDGKPKKKQDETRDKAIKHPHPPG